MTTKGNVYQRKARVTTRCREIACDKIHPAHKFPYISIQNVSKHLAVFSVEEGLDITASIVDDTVVVELTNVDEPTEKITSTWPIVAGDKGFAYSFKFPLVRLFLMGDGEEADEAVMASNSGAARDQPMAAATNGAASGPVSGFFQEGDTCQECAKVGRKRVFKPAKGGDRKGELCCSFQDENDQWQHHYPNDVFVESFNDPTPIPF